MTRKRSTVVVVNYHRVACGAEPEPRHLLHTVDRATFLRQIERCLELGTFRSLDDVLRWDDLGPRTFLVTFDDVPAITLHASATLAGEGIPHAVSVCGRLATDGHGWRDQVYAIARHGDRARVRDAVSAVLGECVDKDAFSFYDFTKSGRLHPDEVSELLVEPLFAELPAEVRSEAHRKTYAGWDAILGLANEPLVTLSNHGWSHASYQRLSSHERRVDVTRGHEAMAAVTGRPPRHFTVPFGVVHHDVLFDLTATLRELGYRTILWTEGRSNLVVEPYLRREMLHLLRIDAAPSMASFEDQLRRALDAPLRGPIDVQSQSTVAGAVTVSAGTDPEPAAVLETVLRPDKDYAAARVFYDYAFASNPFRGRRPDYVVATSAASPQAIAYAFHSRFAVGAAVADGLYVASWRRLPTATPATSPAVLRRLTRGERVVGVYRPSLHAVGAFRGWTSVTVYDHAIDLGLLDGIGLDGTVVELEAYDSRFASLARRATEGLFTVMRDAVFNSWRFDRYPLAQVRYVALDDGSGPTAYAVVLLVRDAAAIADFVAPDAADLVTVVNAALAVARRLGARSITVETSSIALSDALVRSHDARRTTFRNFYRLAPGLRAELPASACVDGVWDPRFVHETQATGDVLLR